MNGRSIEQLGRWLADGIAIFARWGVGRPVALRTGSLITDRTVYLAMEQAGIRIGSNIAFGVHRPGDPGLHFYSGIQQVGGVTELCVLTYADFGIGNRTHARSLSITGSSWSETRTLLERAHDFGVESVVILTHPFEYVKYERLDFSGLLPNRINQRRLARLCKFLRDQPDRFEVMAIGDLASSPRTMPSKANVLLKVPMMHAVGRIVQNGLNDWIRGL